MKPATALQTDGVFNEPPRADNTLESGLITVNVDESEIHYRALNHLLRYQWAKSSYDWAADCKYVNFVAEKTNPVCSTALQLQPLLKTVVWADGFCDRRLTSIDRVVDLSSTQIDDLTRLARGTFEMISLVTLKGVIEPTFKRVNAVGALVHSVLHNEDGKAIIPSIVDPLVSPVNVLLEKAQIKISPDSQKVDEQSSELKRAYKILANIVKSQKEEMPAPEVEQATQQVTVPADQA